MTAIGDGRVASDDNQRGSIRRVTFFVRTSSRRFYLLHSKDGWRVDLAKTYAENARPEELAQISADHKHWQEFGEVFRSSNT